MLDQGLFSGANFVVNVLLARWLPPEEYGGFAVALSVFYLMAGFHTAVLTEPMVIFGAGKYRDHFRRYLGMLLYAHGGISLLIVLALGGAAFAMHRFGSAAMAQALAGLTIASPFLLLIWLTRRACYVPMRPEWALAGSGINFLITLGGMFFLWREGILTSLSALALLGVAAGVSALFLLLELRPRLVAIEGNPTPAMVVRDHWGYGTWNLLSVATYWASGQILMLLIPVFLGLAASAAVAAVWNLYRPVSLFMQSLGLVLIPTFSGWVNKGMAPPELKRRAVRFASLFGGAVLLYGLVLTAAAEPVLHLLYAEKYAEHQLLVLILGISTTLSTVVGIFVSILKVQGKIRQVPTIFGLSALISVPISIALMIKLGVEGAMMGAVISWGFSSYFAYRQVRK